MEPTTTTKIILRKKEGEYKTPIYLRKAYKDYTRRIRENDPVKHEKMLEYQRQYRQRKKLLKEQTQTETPIKV